MPIVTTVKRRRLVNAGRRRHNARRRHMTAKQIKFFGTKRQRAALKHNRARKRVASNAGMFSRRKTKKRFKSFLKRRGISDYPMSQVRSLRKKPRANTRHRRRKHNVRSIVTVYPLHMNAGRRKNVARRRRRHNAVHHRRRRHNVAYRGKLSTYRGIRSPGRYVYSSNPRRRRRHNVHHRRRHNQGRLRRAGGMLGGTAGKVLSIIGGATVTKLISDLLPATFQTGVLGYLGIGVVAVAQGQLIGGIMKSSSIRENMTAGGLVYLTIKILNDFIPSLGGTLGLRGMGLIAPTQGFAVPLVNQGGSMGMFVRPGFVPAPYVPATTGALGSLQSIRRGGRVR